MCDHALSDCNTLMNNVTEVFLDDHARMDYYQVQNQHLGASQVNSLFVSANCRSVFDSNIITLYGGFIRNNLYVALNREGGECNLYGMYISDKNQIVDNFSYIDHIAPHCTSREHFKGVMDAARWQTSAAASGCAPMPSRRKPTRRTITSCSPTGRG